MTARIKPAWLRNWDLDDPFAGHARLSVRQMQKVQAHLEAEHHA